MKFLTMALLLMAAAVVMAQNSVSGTSGQVSSYSGVDPEDENNAGGKATSRVGNGSGYYSMLIRLDLTGMVPTEVCTLYLVQATDTAEGRFNTRVSTVVGNWENGYASEDPEEGSVCYKYRAYSATAPVLWIVGNDASTLNSVSNNQGGSHENSTDVILNTSISGLMSYAVLDLSLIQDLASGACGGLRISRALGQSGEIRFSNNGVMLSWDPSANPVVVERNIRLVSDNVFNTPNPFAPMTTIQYSGSEARVYIYDLSGSLIRTLSGKNGSAVWNGRDASGREAACGAYVYRVDLDGRQIVRTLNLAR